MSDPKYINIGHPAMNLAEACGELIKAVSKIERFGLQRRHPVNGPSYIERLRSELLDLQGAYDRYLKHIFEK